MKGKRTTPRGRRTTTRIGMNDYSILKSPVGDLMLIGHESALTGLYFVGCGHLPEASQHWRLNPQHSVFLEAAQQLSEYFAGKRQRFSLPIHLEGTDFQKRIWHEIALIPFGETIAYSELATRVGAPQAIRAAGTSTGRNPVAIIIPCHRVMGKNGSMCGFAGGLERKRHLLDLENSPTCSGVGRAYNQLSWGLRCASTPG